MAVLCLVAIEERVRQGKYCHHTYSESEDYCLPILKSYCRNFKYRTPVMGKRVVYQQIHDLIVPV